MARSHHLAASPERLSAAVVQRLQRLPGVEIDSSAAPWDLSVVHPAWRLTLTIDEGATQSRLNAEFEGSPEDAESIQKQLALLRGDLHGGPGATTADEAVRARLCSGSVAGARLRPRRIAQQEGLSVAAVFTALMEAQRDGRVRLAWSPLCVHASSDPRADVALATRGVHCDVCGIGRGDVLDSMEAVFMNPLAPPPVTTTVRREPVEVQKVQLEPGQTSRFRFPFRPGRYHFSGGNCTAVIDVDTEHPPLETVELFFGSPSYSVVKVAPGPNRLRLMNAAPVPVEVQITRHWRPQVPLTARQALENSAIPLSCAQLTSTFVAVHGCMVHIAGIQREERRIVAAVLRESGADHVERSSATMTDAFFGSVSDALLATEQLMVRQLDVGVGIGFGRARLTGAPPQFEGPALDLAIEASQQADRPQHAVASVSLPIVRQALEAHPRPIHLRPRSRSSALLLYAAVIDGAPLLDIPLSDPERVAVLTEMPERLGNLKLGEPIDQGGVAEILSAETPTGEPRVVKILHPHLATQKLVQAFTREGYYSAQLQHPNIVKAYDWGQVGGRPYIVMERLVGLDLYKLVRRVGPLPLGEVFALTQGLLEALKVVHAKGWVHRDIKPHNVFRMDPDDSTPYRTKLLDFGLTRPAGRSSTEHFAGTPEFMAPEQVELGHIDQRADLFGVGALAYYLCTAKAPFTGGSRGEGAVRRIAGAIRQDVDPAMLGPLIGVIERALEVDRERRWESAEAMLEAWRASV